MEVVSPDDRSTEEPHEGAFVTQVVAGDRMSVQHFRAEPGPCSPEHSHEHEELGFIAEGSWTITVNGDEQTAEAGDVYRIPGGEPHSSENPGDQATVGIQIFSPPRPSLPDAIIDE